MSEQSWAMSKCYADAKSSGGYFFCISKGMDAPLPIYWQAAITPVSHIHRVHSTWKCITLQLKLLHQLAHRNILLRIYSPRLVLEECHQDF